MSSTSTTTTTDDFSATKTFAAPTDAVYAALTDLDALTAWWTPAGGGADKGQTLRFLMGDQQVVMHVEQAERPARVRWNVLVCEPAHDWEGTSISFTLAPAGAGTELRFQHHGLNPHLECFDQCHAGWTHFLTSLVDYVDHGGGTPNPPVDVEQFMAWRAEHAAR